MTYRVTLRFNEELNDFPPPGMLKSIDNAREAGLILHVPPGVRAWFREYHRCTGCGSLYWKGSHYEKLAKKSKRNIKKEVKAP